MEEEQERSLKVTNCNCTDDLSIGRDRSLEHIYVFYIANWKMFREVSIKIKNSSC